LPSLYRKVKKTLKGCKDAPLGPGHTDAAFSVLQ